MPAGQILVLLGTSGSGKTTALKTLNRLVRADSGRVSVLGPRRGELGPDRACAARSATSSRRWACCPISRWPRTSASSRACSGGTRSGAARARASCCRWSAWTRTGSGPLCPRELSGGERQRAGLARALAADPPLLLMDEPFGALDPLTRRRLQDEFKALQRRLGKTVVLVTHDVPEALRLGDRVAVMHAGRVVQEGTAAEIRDHPQAGFVRDFLAAALP